MASRCRARKAAGRVNEVGSESHSQINAGAARGGVAQAEREAEAAADLLTAPRRMLAINRRSLFRVPVALPIDISLSAKGSDALRSTTLDISQGGLRVLVPSRLDEDLRVRVSLHLSEDEVVSAHATVRHCVRGANGYATGLSFGVLAGADARTVAQAMARHQRRLQPQVHHSLLVHWTSPSSARSQAASTVAISPGAVAVHTQEDLELGDRLSLEMATPHQKFTLGVTVVDRQRSEERNRGLLAIDVLAPAEEKQLRAALHDLQDEEGR